MYDTGASCLVLLDSLFSWFHSLSFVSTLLVYVLLIHLFVCFAPANFCPFRLPLGVRGLLRLVTEAYITASIPVGMDFPPVDTTRCRRPRTWKGRWSFIFLVFYVSCCSLIRIVYTRFGCRKSHKFNLVHCYYSLLNDLDKRFVRIAIVHIIRTFKREVKCIFA